MNMYFSRQKVSKLSHWKIWHAIVLHPTETTSHLSNMHCFSISLIKPIPNKKNESYFGISPYLLDFTKVLWKLRKNKNTSIFRTDYTSDKKMQTKWKDFKECFSIFNIMHICNISLKSSCIMDEYVDTKLWFENNSCW